MSNNKNSNYVVGLGNPGSHYKFTRHNIGFMLLDILAQNFNFPEFSKKFDGLISASDIGGNRVVLFKPYTFMNNSGQPLLKLMSFYKVKCEYVTVIHDDIDLTFGKIKVKQGGGNGGHNGLKSIDQHISNNYLRLRIGVGRPDVGDLSDYVLSKFAQNEGIEKILNNIVAHFKLLFAEDKNLFMQNI